MNQSVYYKDKLGLTEDQPWTSSSHKRNNDQITGGGYNKFVKAAKRYKQQKPDDGEDYESNKDFFKKEQVQKGSNRVS